MNFVSFGRIQNPQTPPPHNFHHLMRGVASGNMRSEAYSVGIAMRMRMMRPGYGDWRELRRAQMECHHKGVAVHSEAVLLPQTSYWGEIEEIMSICPLAPNGVIYCLSANLDHVKRLSIRNNPSVGLAPLSEDAGDIRALTSRPHDAVLIFNGVNHWGLVRAGAPSAAASEAARSDQPRWMLASAILARPLPLMHKLPHSRSHPRASPASSPRGLLGAAFKVHS